MPPIKTLRLSVEQGIHFICNALPTVAKDFGKDARRELLRIGHDLASGEVTATFFEVHLKTTGWTRIVIGDEQNAVDAVSAHAAENGARGARINTFPERTDLSTAQDSGNPTALSPSE